MFMEESVQCQDCVAVGGKAVTFKFFTMGKYSVLTQQSATPIFPHKKVPVEMGSADWKRKASQCLHANYDFQTAIYNDKLLY